MLPFIILVIYLLMSGLTFMAYFIDKLRARAGEWRVPENTLHILELLGGWPGAILAQKYIRHKNRDTSYQMVFQAIVGMHLFVLLLWIFVSL